MSTPNILKRSSVNYELATHTEIDLSPFKDLAQFAYKSPKLEARHQPEKGIFGLFATEAIKKDEILTIWGGIIISSADLANIPDAFLIRTVQVEEDFYHVSLHLREEADYANHSCEPNAGLSGQIVMVALRDIEEGEEICFDYAMSDGTPVDEFECHCGSDSCRGYVTGNDWKLPALWTKYNGYFSPYLQRRIDAINAKK